VIAPCSLLGALQQGAHATLARQIMFLDGASGGRLKGASTVARSEPTAAMGTA
jgi:hypothetical protein